MPLRQYFLQVKIKQSVGQFPKNLVYVKNKIEKQEKNNNHIQISTCPVLFNEFHEKKVKKRER